MGRISVSAGTRSPSASKRIFTPSWRVVASLGMRQTRGALAGVGAVEPGFFPSTSHQPKGTVAAFDWPGATLPKISSLPS